MKDKGCSQALYASKKRKEKHRLAVLADLRSRKKGPLNGGKEEEIFKHKVPAGQIRIQKTHKKH